MLFGRKKQTKFVGEQNYDRLMKSYIERAKKIINIEVEMKYLKQFRNIRLESLMNYID
jgi:hypothetical protein